MVASLKVSSSESHSEKDAWRVQHFALKKEIVGQHKQVSQIKAACEVTGHGEIALVCRVVDKKLKSS